MELTERQANALEYTADALEQRLQRKLTSNTAHFTFSMIDLNSTGNDLM